MRIANWSGCWWTFEKSANIPNSSWVEIWKSTKLRYNPFNGLLGISLKTQTLVGFILCCDISNRDFDDASLTFVSLHSVYITTKFQRSGMSGSIQAIENLSPVLLTLHLMEGGRTARRQTRQRYNNYNPVVRVIEYCKASEAIWKAPLP